MELKDYARALRRRWIWAVAVLVLFVALGVTGLFTLPRQYQSTARLVIVPDSITSANEATLQNRASSYLSLTRSEELARLVIDELDLSTSPRSLLSRVSASLDPDTVVLTLRVTDRSATTARVVTQAYATSFVRYLGAIELSSGLETAALNTQEQLDRAAEASPLQIVQPATEPDGTVSPSPVRLVGGGIVLGLVAGVAVALLVDARRRRVHRVEEVARLDPDATVLGVVTRPTAGSTPGPLSMDSLRRAAAPLRTQTGRVVLTGDGALVDVASGLALALGELGRSTVLVDADLRDRHLTRHLHLDEVPGLAEAAAAGQVERARPTWLGRNVTVVSAGLASSDPGALLASPDVEDMISASGRHHDLTLVQTAPLLDFADAGILARGAGLLVVMFELGATPAQELSRAFEQAHAMGVAEIAVLAVTPARDEPSAGAVPATAPVEVTSEPEPPTPTEEPSPGARRAVRARRRA